ncbi:hypothetical protein DERF_005434 [Dermatophagoides farinae]|uniref:Uncharacterized protein n=1 Tax=Dermatophagoides farinae TaxID=6954 RepID=A0A922I5C0_DERFA|nr:hypothetical protein DERF_005434 [Dermatophagoides farinae]
MNNNQNQNQDKLLRMLIHFVHSKMDNNKFLSIFSCYVLV